MKDNPALAVLPTIMTMPSEQIVPMAESLALEDYQEILSVGGDIKKLPETYYSPEKIAIRATSEYINKLNQAFVGSNLPMLGAKVTSAIAGDSAKNAKDWVTVFKLFMDTLAKNKTPAVVQQFNFPNQSGVDLTDFKIKE